MPSRIPSFSPPGIQTGMRTQLEFISGGRPIRLHAEEIAAPTPHKAVEQRPALLLMHGSGGNVDFWTSRLSPFLREGGINLYAPRYFDRTSTGRADLAMITDGVHVPRWIETLDAALHFVAARPGVDPQRIVVAGVSLGAFLALAFAAEVSAASETIGHPRIRALLDVSGGLVEPYAARATSRMPPTLILHGATDNIVPVAYAHDLDQKLTELQVPHRTEILYGEGHWFSAGALPRMLSAVSHFLEHQLA